MPRRTFITEVSLPEGTEGVGARCIVHTLNSTMAVQRSAKEWHAITGVVWPVWSNQNQFHIVHADDYTKILCTVTILYEHKGVMGGDSAVKKMLSL